MDGKLGIALHMRYISVYMPYVHNLESARVHGRFYVLALKKDMVVMETHHGYARVVNDEENGCRFEGQRKETRIYM